MMSLTSLRRIIKPEGDDVKSHSQLLNFKMVIRNDSASTKKGKLADTAVNLPIQITIGLSPSYNMFNYSKPNQPCPARSRIAWFEPLDL